MVMLAALTREEAAINRVVIPPKYTRSLSAPRSRRVEFLGIVDFDASRPRLHSLAPTI